MRVTGGVLRGRVLRVPRGQGVRPTGAKLREAVFSILGQRLPGAAVLDLFAGAGTLGIEAVSRGATKLVIVERHRGHAATLRRNLELAAPHCEHELLQQSAERALKTLQRRGERFDLVFIDPPYGQELASWALQELSSQGLLLPSATMVVETGRGEHLPDPAGDWGAEQRRIYGQTELAFYRRLNAADGVPK